MTRKWMGLLRFLRYGSSFRVRQQMKSAYGPENISGGLKLKRSYKVACLYVWLLERHAWHREIWKGGVNSNALDVFLCGKESEAINHLFIHYEVFIYCEVTGVAIVSVRKELNELCQSTLDRSPRVLEQHRRNSEAEETLEFNPSMVFWRKTQPYTESKSDHWILVRKSRISFVLLLICKYGPNTAFVLEVLSIIYS